MATNVATLTAKLVADTSKLSSGLNEAEKDVESFKDKSKKSFDKFATAAKVASIAAAAAVVAGAVKSVAAYAEFESGMNEVFTLLPGISEDAMDEMADQTKDLAKEMGILPDDAIPAIYQALSAGVPKDNVFEFMEVASRAAIGGAVDLEVAVDGITSTVNAYGAANITAGKASDLMFTAVRLGKTTMDELSRSLFQVNPVAAALGVNFGDVTAALATMTAQGTPTTVATTQLRQALVELGKQGSAAFDHFKEATGQTFPDFIAGGGTVEEAFITMKDRADDMGVGVGDLFGSVEAGMGVISLTSESGAKAFSTAMVEMQDSAGATDAAFDTMDQGLSRTWDKIKAQFATALIDIGERLAPLVQQFADWFQNKLPAMIDFTISAVETVVDVIGNFAEGISKIIGWFKDLPAPIGTVVKVLGFVAVALIALSATPVMAGLALVAAAIAFIGSSSADTKRDVEGIKSDLEELGLISLDSLKEAFGDDVIDDMRRAGLTLRDITATVGDMLDPAVVAASQKVEDFMNAAGEEGSLKKFKDGLFKVNVELMTQTREAEELRKELLKTNAAKGFIKHQQDMQTEIDLVNRRTGELVDVLADDLDPTLRDVATSIGDLPLDEFAMDFEDMTEDMQKSMTELGTSILEEVDSVIGLFQGAPEQMKIGTDEMIANLIETQTAAAEWQTNMQTLIALGMTGLVAELEEGGIEAAGAVAAFAADANAALEAELRLDGIIGPQIQNVQGLFDSLNLSDFNGTMRALQSGLGISRTKAEEVYAALLLLNGVDVEFQVVGTWVLDPPPSISGSSIEPIWQEPSGIIRYHGGGLVGGTSGTKEVLAVLQKGEGVIDSDTMSSGISASGGDINVYVAGSVVSERDLVSMVARGLEQRRKHGS